MDVGDKTSYEIKRTERFLIKVEHYKIATKRFQDPENPTNEEQVQDGVYYEKLVFSIDSIDSH